MKKHIIIATAAAAIVVSTIGAVAHIGASPRPARSRPLRTISVKVMPTGTLNATERWRITAADTDSCTAWADERATIRDASTTAGALRACEGRIVAAIQQRKLDAEAAGVTIDDGGGQQ